MVEPVATNPTLLLLHTTPYPPTRWAMVNPSYDPTLSHLTNPIINPQPHLSLLYDNNNFSYEKKSYFNFNMAKEWSWDKSKSSQLLIIQVFLLIYFLKHFF
jgi:hypothetical protein